MDFRRCHFSIFLLKVEISLKHFIKGFDMLFIIAGLSPWAPVNCYYGLTATFTLFPRTLYLAMHYVYLSTQKIHKNKDLNFYEKNRVYANGHNVCSVYAGDAGHHCQYPFFTLIYTGL